MVPNTDTAVDSRACASGLQKKLGAYPQSTRSSTPPDSAEEASPASLQDLRGSLTSWGISSGAADLVMNSWRQSTQKADMYDSGASHSTVNLARSAVSAYLRRPGTEAVGSHPLVCRLVKGVFENRPSIPKY